MRTPNRASTCHAVHTSAAAVSRVRPLCSIRAHARARMRVRACVRARARVRVCAWASEPASAEPTASSGGHWTISGAHLAVSGAHWTMSEWASLTSLLLQAHLLNLRCRCRSSRLPPATSTRAKDKDQKTKDKKASGKPCTDACAWGCIAWVCTRQARALALHAAVHWMPQRSDPAWHMTWHVMHVAYHHAASSIPNCIRPMHSTA